MPSPTLYYQLDAVMVPRYFRRFLDEVKAWTSKQATRADRPLGKRAQRVVLTLMTSAKSDDRGPRPIHKEVLEDRRAYVLKHRPPLLREAQQIVRAYRPPQGTPLEYRDRLVRLYHKYHPMGDRVEQKVDRWLARKALRAVDITNAILGAKLKCTPSRIQQLAASGAAHR